MKKWAAAGSAGNISTAFATGKPLENILKN
jgi:hypothetical protein